MQAALGVQRRAVGGDAILTCFPTQNDPNERTNERTNERKFCLRRTPDDRQSQWDPFFSHESGMQEVSSRIIAA